MFVETYRSHIGYVAPDGDVRPVRVHRRRPQRHGARRRRLPLRHAERRRGRPLARGRDAAALDPAHHAGRRHRDGRHRDRRHPVPGAQRPRLRPRRPAVLHRPGPLRRGRAARPRLHLRPRPLRRGRAPGRAAVGLPERHRGRGLRRRRLGRVVHPPGRAACGGRRHDRRRDAPGGAHPGRPEGRRERRPLRHHGDLRRHRHRVAGRLAAWTSWPSGPCRRTARSTARG